MLLKTKVDENNMTWAEISIRIPEQMIPFLQNETKQEELLRNAMILYPYIRRGLISHGRASEVLGITKWDLIHLYNSMDCPYLSNISDYEDDLNVISELKNRL